MGTKGKMEAEIEIKSSGDLFHELLGSKPHHISNITPHNIQSCDVHEGEFGKPGSIIFWNYVLDGKPSVAKERVEAIDEENKAITFRIIEGHLLDDYECFVIMVHVTTKGENNVVKWTFDYEKRNEDTPYPTKLVDLALNVTKDIEAHHLNA